ncbi:MAG: hypothetical protein HY654_09920 [Acidobacteria bacterium]|nr:hypothetical protein [Acidobacteriota bacterium]
MSKARRVTDESRVRPFEWILARPSAGAAPRASEAAPADAAQQQARFAQLEREAFAKGYAQGEKVGMEAGAKRADAMLRRLANTLEELHTLRASMIRSTDRQLVQLALAIAKRILRKEVKVDEELTLALARVALDRLGETSGPTTIRLHPDDHSVLTALGSLTQVSRHLTIVADSAISRGGCLVESEFGYIDASIDTQFQELARVLVDTDDGDAARLSDDDS